jgi:hypothetical protein
MIAAEVVPGAFDFEQLDGRGDEDDGGVQFFDSAERIA